MQVVVCVKQVPAGHVSMDPERGTLVRSGETCLNPPDAVALEVLRTLRLQSQLSVTALTMGPAQAEKVLKTSIALGADKGVLLCDEAFSGSDVYATAYALAGAVRRLGDCELILCGQHSVDGDTAQLPFSLAAQLGLPCAGWVRKILSLETDKVMVEQEVSGGIQTVVLPLPCVLAISADAAVPHPPTLSERLSARKAVVSTLSCGDLEDSLPAHYGLNASPTRVKKLFAQEISAKTQPLEITAEQAVKLLEEELKCWS